MMPTTTVRLDTELVNRGLARSRRRATELVASGRVAVDGELAQKPSQRVSTATPVTVRDDEPEYVSRAAHKLAGALGALASVASPGPTVRGSHCVDAGASTGGFTQVLLERGAGHVVAVDVGHGQLAPVVAQDPRVTALEGVNVRDLAPGDLPGPPADLAVADLSFISLGLVLPALVGIARDRADLLLMVKPQFEVGRPRLGAGGVVTDPALREEAVLAVATGAAPRAHVRAVVPSPLAGEAGNREYFLWLVVGPGDQEADARLRGAVHDAVTLDRPVLVEEVR